MPTIDVHRFRIHHSYKIDTARFEEGKRPSHSATCNRTKPSPDAWTPHALTDQDGKKVLMWPVDEAEDGEDPPVPDFIATEARFGAHNYEPLGVIL